MEAPLHAPIFDVQRFSIHDGPGIRTTVFFKGCNLECSWCQNPESQDVAPILSFYETRCEEHFACADICPHSAIIKGEFRIDYERCTLCQKCIDACPNSALQLIGQPMTPKQLFEQILADLPYYQSSGGGVTFSGGEPTLYPAFIDEVVDLCNEHGIHTNLETCGTFSKKRWAKILPKLDMIYFDLKLMDSILHKSETGLGNERILENAQYLVTKGYPVEFRLPLVPGITDNLENLKETAEYLTLLGQDKLHLLGYHRMGESKIDIIGGKQKKLKLESYSDDQLAEITNWFEQQGFVVVGT